MKRKLLLFIKPFAIFFLSIFFEKKYLRGRYFEHSLMGVRWCFYSLWVRNILRLAKPLPFPAALTCHVTNPNKIFFHPDDVNNFQSPGVYFQNFKAEIHIGKGTYIGPNVGVITANHDVTNLVAHDEGENVVLGRDCWIGMNSIIMPGVCLGDRVIVGAGSVVTKSFESGDVVIAGSPAKVIRKVDVK